MAVFLKLGFREEDAFWMLIAVLEDLVPECHCEDALGVVRDVATTHMLLQLFLPAQAAWLAADKLVSLPLVSRYVLALAADVAPLPLIVRLWDL